MIRIGIVGCGRILAAHLQGYRLLRQAGIDTFRITALCARRAEDAQMYVRRGKGPPQRPAVSDLPGDPLAVGDEYLSDFQDDADVAVYTDFREMIANGPIDAVNDFTTHALHHQIAAEAFAQGKDLLTQKPLAISMAAGRRMCRLARDSQRVFGVFENFRQSARTRHIRWAFESGTLGKLQMILLGFAGVWWAPNRIVAETPWRHKKIEAGGISLDLGVHFIDQIRHVAGEIKTISAQTAVLEPQRVTLDAQGQITEIIDCDADDTLMAQFVTEAGVPGNMFASWGGHGAASRTADGIVYYGSAGRISASTVTFDDGQVRDLGELYQEKADSQERERCFPHGLENNFALNQLDWLEAIQQRREPETSGSEGLRDLAAAYAILESAHAGRPVQVADVLDGRLADFQRPINQHWGLA